MEAPRIKGIQVEKINFRDTFCKSWVVSVKSAKLGTQYVIIRKNTLR